MNRFYRVLSCLLPLCTACVSEQSVRLGADDVRALRTTSTSLTTREWLEAAHDQFKPLLPANTVEPMRTPHMRRASCQPADVWNHFGLRPAGLRTIAGNYTGLLCTAKAASRDFHIDTEPPPWPDFQTVWIPVDSELSLCARWGMAANADATRDATAILLLPAMFGDNGVLRTRDLAMALRHAGYHVLSVELRGYGQTEKRYPHYSSTFGVLELQDTLAVHDWLEKQPCVRRIGLLGFCWGGNTALLAAWFDGRRANDPSISPAIERLCRTPARTPYFSAGIMAVSPILRWEDLLDELDKPHTALADPIMAGVQDTIRQRMARKRYPNPNGSMRRLIELEYENCGHRIPGGAIEGYPFLRLMNYRDRPAHDKLEAARVPVLVVHGANDPLAPAQDVGDFLASIDNPRVAGVILPGGGHVGFATYAPRYYFSLMVNFFDPLKGPGAMGHMALIRR